MIRKLTIGQYVFKDSVIHGVDSRLKIVYVLVLSIIVFTIGNLLGIIFFSGFIIAVLLLSKIDFKRFVKGLMPFYLIFVFIIVMYLIFARDKLNQGFITIWRFLILITISLILTFTTTISDLVLAIENLSKPLKVFGIRPRNVAVMISIAIRFVPVMFINMEKTRDAMLSRLANFRKLKILKIFIIVLLKKMLKSASNLSDAMYARVYNEDIENKKKVNFKAVDYISILIIILIIIII